MWNNFMGSEITLYRALSNELFSSSQEEPFSGAAKQGASKIRKQRLDIITEAKSSAGFDRFTKA